MHNTQTSRSRCSETLSKQARMLLLIVLSGLMLIAPMAGQSFTAANRNTGTILGMVLDTSDDPIPGASVVLQGPAGDHLTAVTKDDGAFAFDQAPAGGPYHIA